MAVTSNRTVTIEFTGDVEFSQEFDADASNSSPGQIQVVDLASGNNTITVPSGAEAVTIIPPDGNTTALTLKGVSGDTGIVMAPNSPSSLGLDGVSSFVISAGGSVTGLRLIYT